MESSRNDRERRGWCLHVPGKEKPAGSIWIHLCRAQRSWEDPGGQGKVTASGSCIQGPQHGLVPVQIPQDNRSTLVWDPWVWLDAGAAEGSAGLVSHQQPQIRGCASPSFPDGERQLRGHPPGAAGRGFPVVPRLGAPRWSRGCCGCAQLRWPRGFASSPAPKGARGGSGAGSCPGSSAPSCVNRGARNKGALSSPLLVQGGQAGGSGSGTVAAGDGRARGSATALWEGAGSGMEGGDPESVYIYYYIVIIYNQFLHIVGGLDI